MKILLAGATGALGIPLTRALVSGGHDVLALVRDPEATGSVASLGASPIVADALDRDALLLALDGQSADAVVHELTALKRPPRNHAGMAMTDRLRTEGTTNLLAAADALGANRFVTQSIIFGYGFYDHGDKVLDESAPFGQRAGNKGDRHIAAIASAEQKAFTAPVGVALRYGLLYGGDPGGTRAQLASRAVPVAPGGVLGWVHHDDAVAATVAAIEQGRAGQAYNIVDDQAATWTDVFTAMAAALGAPPPRHLPAWMFHLVAPYVASFVVDTSMCVDNTKAKSELGWRPSFATYHEGIDAMVGDLAVAAS